MSVDPENLLEKGTHYWVCKNSPAGVSYMQKNYTNGPPPVLEEKTVCEQPAPVVRIATPEQPLSRSLHSQFCQLCKKKAYAVPLADLGHSTEILRIATTSTASSYPQRIEHAPGANCATIITSHDSGPQEPLVKAARKLEKTHGSRANHQLPSKFPKHRTFRATQQTNGVDSDTRTTAEKATKNLTKENC